MLVCPKCKLQLDNNNNQYRCLNNHSYDISKEGYINLLLNKSFSGDNKMMVDSRYDFLHAKMYDFLLEELNDIIRKYNITSLLDCGCGEGYYTNRLVLNNKEPLYGIDISKDAIKKAAKEAKQLKTNYKFIVGSLYNIPFSDNSFDCITNICAPLFKEEFHRVLNENGILIKVIPSSNHLIELKENLYDNVYLNDEFVSSELEEIESKYVTKQVVVKKPLIEALLKMTPYYYKTKKEAIDKLLLLDELKITFSFKVIVHRG